MPSKPPSPKALELARERLEEALSEHPDDPTLLLLRCRADARVGNYQAAASYFERASRGFLDLGDLPSEASARLDGGMALSRAGFDDEARAFYQRGIAAFELQEDALGAAHARIALARHELAHRQFGAAREELERALEPLAEAEAYTELGWACERLVELTRRDEHVEVVLEHARVAVEAAAKAHDREPFGGRLVTLGTLHREAGNAGKARGYLNKALPYLRESGPRSALLEALLTLAELATERERREQALNYLEEALKIADRGAPVVDRWRVRLQLATSVVDATPERARHLIGEVVTMMDEAPGDRAAWLQLASVQSRLGEAQAARESLARARPAGADY
ncbi:MAG: tetratricopeptide repeat protein [Myxococcota bacterium]